MYNQDNSQDQEIRTIANEMLEVAIEERKNKDRLRRMIKVVNTIIAVVVVLAIVWVAKTLLSSESIRDKTRQSQVLSIAKEIVNYKGTHRNNLPQETSIKQWQKEFIEPYLANKEFFREPLNDKEYKVVINDKKTAREIIDINDLEKVFIDQSSSCADGGNIKKAGSAFASVRLKLESGEVYCVNAE